MDLLNAVRHPSRKGNHPLPFRQAENSLGLLSGKPFQKRSRRTKSHRHFQRLGQHSCQIFQFLRRGDLSDFPITQPVQHRGAIKNGALVVQFHQPPAHIQASGLHHFSFFNQAQVAGSSADVHVHHGLSRFPGKFLRPSAFCSQDTFQVRPCRCHHKIPGQIRQSIQNRPGIFLPAGFPGDDNGAGIHRIPGDSRFLVLQFHDFPDFLPVHMTFIQQGSKIHRAAVANVPLSDFHSGYGKCRSLVFHCQFRHNQLG